MKNRIVITGMGAVTPIGTDVETYWNNLIGGVCGIGPIRQFDPAAIPVKVAAEVKDFVPEDHMPKALVRETVPFMQFGYAATMEALAQSGLEIEQETDRIGVTFGTALVGVTHIADTQREADAMVAMGAESSICPVIMAGLASARALSRNEDPETACRPFDVRRDGFVMGEGGGALILETEAHALARGAKILGVVMGSANNTDGHHVTAPDPAGKGAIGCMTKAMETAGLSPADIGYINTHGTSTPMGDAIEIAAIRNVFGTDAPPVSSTKSATGHMMGAGGITEVIACVKAVETGILPPTIHCIEQDPACDLDVIPNEARYIAISYAMSNAFGFGGQNSSVIVGRYEE